jgi:hypothetical protein
MGFAVATGFSLWRVEWFDVWRHGAAARPLSYILTSYGPPVAIYTIVGAVLGAATVRPREVRTT